ncbi:DUF1906 domain-containing protein [Cytobacillus spongiae]|uniref:glycoside hydrolase domain-containing protein n=1 Tax=Cytobacillus spongiae TaxID=2901381 RepID=UPI001F3DFAF7|nr:glycoside hydrolase domain-containing protein [Cytobacillus spongiae]UII57787.1 DUF1906 domain-containing protein [Cytobacillus spongiae]
MAYIWGVDSASTVDKELYDCVLTSFGKPNYWGRYITRVEGAAEGLTREEVELLHNSGTKVLPIYSKFLEATGYRNGKVIAQNTIFHANRLSIPKGKVLFANVEKFFAVDEAWIRGYIDGMFPSGYKPGFYNDPVDGDFRNAYCTAVENDNKVSTQAILWSARPEPGVTKARNAPKYKPAKPKCKANVWGWQYGRDSKICPIDTNLIDSRLYELLW